MKERLQSFFVEPENVSVDIDKLENAYLKVRKLLQPEDPNFFLDTLSSRESCYSLPSSTSSGYPYKTRKGRVRKRIHRDELRLEKKIMKTKNPNVYPCIAGARRVVREKGENKPRLIWSYPADISCLESKFSIPVTEYFKTKAWYGARVDWMSKRSWLTELHLKYQNDGSQYIASLDYSQFDSRVPSFIIRIAFNLIRELFQFSSFEHRLFDFIINYFIHTPIHLYDRVFQKHRGIPSGSSFTSIIGTVSNMLISHYLMEVPRGYHIMLGSVWLGDDSRMRLKIDDGLTTKVVLTTLISSALRLGCIVNEDKSDISSINTNKNYLGSFLSRRLYLHGEYIRFDFDKFLASFFIPERKVKTSYEAYIRIIGYMWAYGFNPIAYDFLTSQLNYLFKYHYDEDFRNCNADERFFHDWDYRAGAITPDFSIIPKYKHLRVLYYGHDSYVPCVAFQTFA